MNAYVEIGDHGERPDERNASDEHDALMANLAWNLRWLRHHRHWWIREQEWRKRGRVA